MLPVVSHSCPTRRVSDLTPSADKQTRAQSIQGRMSMGMVHFPNFEPWFEAAHTELMKFPHGRPDDFVDALAHIGLGLSRILKASGERPPKGAPPAELGRRVGRESEWPSGEISGGA